jgi:RimK family alpha-L-glutamate ligase
MDDSSMNVGVVGWAQETNVLLAAAWRERGISARLLTPAEAVAELHPGDVAVGRLDVLPSLAGVEPGLDALDELAARGVRVVNSSEALRNAHDKLLTAALLARAGLPQPLWAHLTGAGAKIPLPLPLVVKPRFGSWGRDVFRCETAADLEHVLLEVRNRPWFVKHGALVQELLPPPGYDLRLLVAAGNVVGAVRRVARPGEWRTNVSLGGTREPVVPPAEARSLGVRAAASIGAEFVGVDILSSPRGPVVLELNGAVEFDETYNLYGDVYDAVADALELTHADLQAAVAR